MPQPDDQQRLIAGRYRLRSVLGHGSMGMVWAAYDEFLRRPVAVKELRLQPGLPASQAEDLRERALREARAIASLSHPNVITLHDVVREHGAPFVVMELLTARSLAGLLADHGLLSTAQAATIGDALAAALEAAHAAGITHRDVKPGNVLVSDDGRVKLTDFGIARNVSDVTMTSAGLMLGSPAYMAPEVASGKKVTPAADLWGLGATLYAVTEGEPPYDADGDPLATANSVVHGDVPEPGPGPLADLIRALMSKDPASRPTPADVRAGLHDLRAPAGPLFAAELFAQAAGPEETLPASEPRAIAQPEETGGTAPLAADPGPLPFAAAPGAQTAGTAVGLAPVARAPVKAEFGALSAPKATLGATPRGPAPRRRPVFTVALAVVLFAVSAVGGFAAARVLGGAPVLPTADGGITATEAPADRSLVVRKGEATMLKGDPDAQFRIKVPANWTKFVTQQLAAPLPASTLIEYVSADGRRTASIERFSGFFDGNELDDYLGVLRSSWPDGGFLLVDPEAKDAGDTVVYRTVESARSPEGGGPPAPGSGGQLGRTTFANLLKSGADLWVVSVTVPTDQENSGRSRLADRILPSFTIS